MDKCVFFYFFLLCFFSFCNFAISFKLIVVSSIVIYCYCNCLMPSYGVSNYSYKHHPVFCYFSIMNLHKSIADFLSVQFLINLLLYASSFSSYSSFFFLFFSFLFYLLKTISKPRKYSYIRHYF